MPATTVTTPAATPGLPATAAATATGSAGPTGTVERPQRLPDGRIFLPKASQRRLELRTATAQAGSWPRSRELLGQVVADPQSGGRVQAAQAGRIAPAPAGAQGLPMLFSLIYVVVGFAVDIAHALLDPRIRIH